MKTNNIANNLKYGKIFSSSCNFLAGALFIVAFFLKGNYAFLITGIVIICIGFAIIVFFKQVEKKFADISKQE